METVGREQIRAMLTFPWYLTPRGSLTGRGLNMTFTAAPQHRVPFPVCFVFYGDGPASHRGNKGFIGLNWRCWCGRAECNHCCCVCFLMSQSSWRSGILLIFVFCLLCGLLSSCPSAFQENCTTLSVGEATPEGLQGQHRLLMWDVNVIFYMYLRGSDEWIMKVDHTKMLTLITDSRGYRMCRNEIEPWTLASPGVYKRFEGMNNEDEAFDDKIEESEKIFLTTLSLRNCCGLFQVKALLSRPKKMQK